LKIPSGLLGTLAAARRPVVLSGAGTSAESGVPTFRDALDGLWSRYRPEELATPEAFRADPGLVWRWYRWRRDLVSQAAPNPGHLALAELARLQPGLRVITQNVDGLHQRAGSADVIELHGNLFVDLCSRSGDPVDAADDASSDQPPPCPGCGAPVRPGVVWFGELLPEAAFAEARELAAGCDVFFSVGTSSLVSPAADLAWLAANAGATLVEINPGSTPLTPHCQYVLEGPSGAVLPALVDALKTELHTGDSP
jgi:NAD-dependent deacetylase